jgi:hypothetical protein
MEDSISQKERPSKGVDQQTKNLWKKPMEKPICMAIFNSYFDITRG